ncbi:hypothetical protein [Pseudomonas sp. 7-41]|uniref:hypothetical protein n=1 Tax=Pseudomonas sp. 7-41 TaxID=2898483 RepID=UPI001E47771E|nr:hypothetical protein [Pseudomonas sp. 7-41]UHH01018.1 hypothetical protein LQ249_30510 [Pseudomonas sp. 7-41]
MIEQTEAPPLLAAFRDASWCSNPDTRTPKRAACGLVAVMCDPEPAEDVPDWQRCKRPGCRSKWPAVE